MGEPLGDYAHLLPPSWKRVITQWLDEDTPSFDYGGFVVGDGDEQAFLWGKSDVCLAPPSLHQRNLTRARPRVFWPVFRL